MIFCAHELAYKTIKEAIEGTEYDPAVVDSEPDQMAYTNFPLITVTLQDSGVVSNNLCYGDPRYRFLIEVNIYAKDSYNTNDPVSRNVIVKHLVRKVEDIMSGTRKFRQTFCKPLPNVDASIARYRMQYRTFYRPSQDMFYPE